MELINRGKFLMERGIFQRYFRRKNECMKIASRTRTRGVEWLALIGSNTQIINYIQKNLYIRNTLIYILDFVTH